MEVQIPMQIQLQQEQIYSCNSNTLTFNLDPAATVRWTLWDELKFEHLKFGTIEHL